MVLVQLGLVHSANSILPLVTLVSSVMLCLYIWPSRFYPCLTPKPHYLPYTGLHFWYIFLIFGMDDYMHSKVDRGKYWLKDDTLSRGDMVRVL